MVTMLDTADSIAIMVASMVEDDTVETLVEVTIALTTEVST